MGNDLKLRRWQAGDCHLLHEWRLHPANRHWFGDSSEIAFDAHQAWFGRFMADRNRFGFILEEDGRPVAQIRFDPAEMPGCYHISLAAAPGKAGRGYGSNILRMACQSEEIRGCASLLVAETIVDNLPSQKIFVRNGFVNAGHGRDGNVDLVCWLLPLVAAVQPVLIQFFAGPDWLEDIERILSATGLALPGDAAARVKIFMGSAVSDEELYSSMLLHLNVSEGTLLDLAMRFPADLKLPIEFYNPQLAVAQIAASLLYLQRN